MSFFVSEETFSPEIALKTKFYVLKPNVKKMTSLYVGQIGKVDYVFG